MAHSNVVNYPFHLLCLVPTCVAVDPFSNELTTSTTELEVFAVGASQMLSCDVGFAVNGPSLGVCTLNDDGSATIWTPNITNTICGEI